MYKSLRLALPAALSAVAFLVPFTALASGIDLYNFSSGNITSSLRADIYQDIIANDDGKTGSSQADGIYGDATSANKICSYVSPTATMVGMTTGSYASTGSGGHGPGDDEWLLQWVGTLWQGRDAKTSNIYLKGGSCIDYSVPSNTLSVSDTSITAGNTVKITWGDSNPTLDQYWPDDASHGVYSSGYADPSGPPATCTSSGFSLPVTTETVCTDWSTGHSGNCGPTALGNSPGATQAASAALALQSCTSYPICAHEGGLGATKNYSATMPSSGSVYVTPSTTTTYTYTCSNPNGTTARSVTVNVAPACAGDSGQTCYSAANACGQTSKGTYSCSGVCSVTAPANPPNYGQVCKPANSCGMTNTGTYTCSGACSVSAPSDSLCNEPPAAPTISALYTSAGAGPSASEPGNNASGYRLYAKAVDPDGDNVDYLLYFYNNQTAAYTALSPQWSGWVGSGGWGFATDLKNFAAGTYQVGGYAQDPSGARSAFSGWQTVTLTAPTVSCGVAPSTGGTSTTYTWTALASGGTGSGYTYAWSGTNLTGKSGSSVGVQYASTGTYTGTVTVKDSNGNSSGAVSCTANGGGTGTGPSVTVVAPASINTFTANPTTVYCGSSTKLAWTSSGATSCTGTGFSTGNAANNTTGVSVTPTDIPTSSYGLQCTGVGGSSSPANTTVTVVPPSVALTALPARVASGAPVTVTWTAKDVKSCVVTANGATIASGNANASGDYTDASAPYSHSITNQTTYSITCTLASGLPSACTAGAQAGAGGTLTTTVTTIANVIPDINNF